MQTNKQIKDIYIHIGAPKTGSTSIQETLLCNKEYLLKQEVYVPNHLFVNHFSLVSLFSDNPAQLKIHTECRRNADEIEIFNRETEAAFLKDLLECNVSKFCITSDAFLDLSSSELESMKAFLLRICPNAKITIIAFVREHISYISSYKQQILFYHDSNTDLRFDPWSKGWTPKREDTLNSQYTNNFPNYLYAADGSNVLFKKPLEEYLKSFEKKDVIVTSFEDACKASCGPAGHFFSLLGVTDEHLAQMSYVRGNEGRSDKSLSLGAFISSKLPFHNQSGGINAGRDYGDLGELRSIRGNKWSIDTELSQELFPEFEEDRLWLKKQFDIDYSTTSFMFKKTNEKLFFGEEYFEDITTYFYTFSQTVQNVIYEYCVEAPLHFTDEMSRKTFAKLTAWIKEYFIITKNAKLLVNGLGGNDETPPYESYYQAGLFLQKNKQLEAAVSCMETAFMCGLRNNSRLWEAYKLGYALKETGSELSREFKKIEIRLVKVVEEILNDLHELKEVTQNRYAIYGTGAGAGYLIVFLKHFGLRLPEFIYDLNPDIQTLLGVRVKNIGDSKNHSVLPVFISSPVHFDTILQKISVHHSKADELELINAFKK